MNSKVYGYYLKKAYGGKAVFARFVDFVMLRAFIFFAQFFLFLHLSKSITAALLISGFLTAAVCIMLHILKANRIKSFIQKDIEDLKRKCLLETITLMDYYEFKDYMNNLFIGMDQIKKASYGFSAKMQEQYMFVLHNHPATKCEADFVLNIFRNNKGKKVTIVALSEFSDCAKSLAKQIGNINLISGEEVLKLAANANMLPDEQTAKAKAEEDMEQNIITLSKIRDAALSGTKVKAYILCGITALLWSLITGFRFYYPIIGLGCFALAFISRRKSRSLKETPGVY